MATRLVDTNIVSFSLKRHKLAGRYAPLTQGFDLAVSFMTLAELHEWALFARWGAGLWGKLRATLTGYSILFPDDIMCRLWAEVRLQRRRQPISASDAWIAATALSYRIPLVTHNPADFAGIAGLTVLTAAR